MTMTDITELSATIANAVDMAFDAANTLRYERVTNSDGVPIFDAALLPDEELVFTTVPITSGGTFQIKFGDAQ